MNFKVNFYYASKNCIDEDIKCFKHESWHHAIQRIMDVINASDNETVYLFTCDGHKDVPEMWPEVSNVFVTSKVNDLKAFLINPFVVTNFENYKNFYLQEYKSYEDAYAVALTMKETSPLCYND